MQKITVNGGDWVPRDGSESILTFTVGERKNKKDKKHAFKFLRKGNLRKKRWIFFSSVKIKIKPKSPSHYPKHTNNFSFVFARRTGEGFACEHSTINYLWCYQLCMTLSAKSYKFQLPLWTCPVSGSTKLHLGII